MLLLKSRLVDVVLRPLMLTVELDRILHDGCCLVSHRGHSLFVLRLLDSRKRAVRSYVVPVWSYLRYDSDRFKIHIFHCALPYWCHGMLADLNVWADSM
jgi:hypothetical protein